jgi:MYXO-CTERM domain-containing protein
MRTYTYNASYFDGGYIVLKGTAPVCTSGQTQSQSCGQCGKQTRTCNSSGQWGTWGTCGGEGPCAANKTDTQTCGSGGHQTRTCDKTCQWGAWSACAGGTECSPGKTETQPCPDPTRSRTRTCSASGAWGAWSNCPSSGADGGVPGVDSGAGWIEPPNGGGDDLGASNPHSSANAGGGEQTGGCQLAGNNEPAALAGVLVLLGLAALRRRR